MLNIAKTGFVYVFAYREHPNKFVFCSFSLTKTLPNGVSPFGNKFLKINKGRK